MDRTEDLHNCELAEPAQINALMIELCRREVPITLRMDGSDLYSASSVLAVDTDAQTLLLDASAAQTINACLARGNPVHVHAQLDKVDVRFILSRLLPSQWQQREAFQAPMPARALHLQRRELHRLSTPLTRWPECEITLDEQPPRTLLLRVADIGTGGMALIHELPAPSLQLGQRLEHCRLHIPDGPILDIDIRICNDRSSNASTGRALRRTGVAFDNLTLSAQKHLSRYIFALDRLRSARRQG